MLILDLNGTNSIMGAGQIIGLSDNNDTPRILTITNVNDVQMANIDLKVQNANNWGRPMLLYANGSVEITGTIDNSDRDSGGDGGNNVSLFAQAIKVGGIDTRSFRSASFRNVGNITLKALAPPDYNPANSAGNTLNNLITITGTLVCTTPQDNTTWGAISCESVVLKLESGANLQTAPAKLTLNVGKVQNGASTGDLFANGSAGSYSPNFVVDWSGSVTPVSPTIGFSTTTPGQLTLTWSGSGFVLQQNASLNNPNGWANAPTETNMPANVTIGSGNLFYRLKWPQ
jgi:hypothetical protein